jgi:hypothetical protein
MAVGPISQTLATPLGRGQNGKPPISNTEPKNQLPPAPLPREAHGFNSVAYEQCHSPLLHQGDGRGCRAPDRALLPSIPLVRSLLVAPNRFGNLAREHCRLSEEIIGSIACSTFSGKQNGSVVFDAERRLPPAVTRWNLGDMSVAARKLRRNRRSERGFRAIWLIPGRHKDRPASQKPPRF